MAVTLAVQLLAAVASAIATVFVQLFVVPKLKFRKFPGPDIGGPSAFIFGQARDFVKRPYNTPQLLLAYARKHGPVYQLWFFFNRLIVVASPADARYILQTLNLPKAEAFRQGLLGLLGDDSILVAGGDFHKAIRQSFQADFNAKFLTEAHPHLVEEFKSLTEKLEAAPSKCRTHSGLSDAVDIDRRLQEVFVTTIVRVVCGFRPTESCDFLVDSLNVCLKHVYSHMLMYPFFNIFKTFKPSIERPLQEHSRIVYDWMQRAICERQSERHGATVGGRKYLLDAFSRVSESKSFVQHNLLTFILAGSDTSAHTLSFALFELSQRRDIVEKMRREIVAVCGPQATWSDGFIPDGAKLRKLQYCKQVFQETLRLHATAATGPLRHAVEDVYLPSGLCVPRGTDVLVPIYALHRSTEFWGVDADMFRPERFDVAELKAKGGLGALGFLPFSLGKRNCIGSFFAEYEVMLFLCGLVMRYDFELACDPGEVSEFHSLTMKPTTDLFAPDGSRFSLPMHFVRRATDEE